MNQYYKLLVLLFLVTSGINNASAQIDADDNVKAEILSTFEVFFEANQNMDAQTIADNIYPKLFDIVPKEQMIRGMEAMKNDTTIKITFQNNRIGKISDLVEIDEIRYSIISYSFMMNMKMQVVEEDEDEMDDFNPLDFTAEMLEMQYGEENVTVDKEDNSINIKTINKAVAIREKDDDRWTFLEYKTNLMPILKQILPTEILDMAAPDPIACVECSTIKDAMVNPEMVESLIISKDLSGVDLESCPSIIGQLTNLEYLYLTGHSFTSIPEEIGNLKNLKELSLVECNLNSLPEEIFTLTGLEEILLYDNDFEAQYLEELKRKFEKLMPDTVVEFE